MGLDTNYSTKQSFSSNNKPAETGKKLWKNLKNNDEEALTRLFYIYYSHLFSYGMKIIPNEDLIKDCIQELFLTLWDKRKNINEAYSVKSYLLISLRRSIFRKLKKQRNRYERDKNYVDFSFEDTLNAEQLIIHFEKKHQDLHKLNKALDSLGKRHKKAIYLKFYEGLNNSEIADVMDINPQSVYNYVSDAICQLQSVVD